MRPTRTDPGLTPLWILLLGLMHGAQPDHAVAAYGIAARTGTAAWRAALRVAAGHAVALAALMAAASLLPKKLVHDFAPFADAAAGGSLLVLAAGLLLQTWRGRYVVHRHHAADGASLHAHHTSHVDHGQGHGHGHAHHKLSGMALGLILGLSGARTMAVILPALVGKTAPVTVLVLHSLGIAVGSVAGAFVLDVARKVAKRWSAEHWVDVAGAAGTAAIGVRLLMTAAP